MAEEFKKKFFISLILTIPVLILSPLIQNLLGFTFQFPGSEYATFLFSASIFFYGGKPFLKGLFKELKNKQPGMMTLIGVAISVAFFYSSAVVFGLEGKFFFWELATLIDVMLLGHWIEMRSVMGASKAMKSLAKIMPSEAHLVKERGTEDVPVSDLEKEDVVLVKAGEKIPADGEVIEGETSVNESMLTGESKPVYKEEGSKVIGGSVNQKGSIKVKVTEAGDESYLSQVIELVKKAQESKSQTQDLASRAATWLTVTSLSVGTITFGVWFYFQEGLAFSLERAVTVMVTTCPHALGLAIPLVVAVSTSLAVRKGILIRDRTGFERTKDVDVLVFDKTGTLTEGKFAVNSVKGRESEEKVLKIAVSLESMSDHPIAIAIEEEAEERGLDPFEVEGFEEIPGKGVKGKIDGKDVKVVGENYVKENGLEVEEFSDETGTISYVLESGEVIGAIALSDVIREGAKEAIEELKENGFKCMMITGDRKKVAERVAGELGLDDFFAEVLPHEKSNKIKELQSRGMEVGMIGDGVNDAPALAQAEVGIAVGAGTDVAIESADVVLVRNDLSAVNSLASLAEATYKKMKQNLFWATGYNIFAIPLAAGILYNQGILLSPAAGAIIMSLSTVIVAVNARFLSV